MKRALGIVFLIGCIMFIVGLAGTVYYTSFHDQQKHTSTQKTYETDGIKKLALDIKGRDVTFVKGDTLKIEGDMSDDHLKTTKNGTQMNVAISSDRRQASSIHLNPFRPLDNKKLIITLPTSKINQVTLNGTDTTMSADALEFVNFTLNLTRADLYMDDSAVQQLNMIMENGGLYTEHTDFKNVIAQSANSDISLEDVPQDIPMSWNVTGGTVDVTYKGPLSNTAFQVEAGEGDVDLDAVNELKNNKVGRGEHQVKIKVSNDGEATFSALD
ncbi:DUF4097 family beta strand repeat-containing protein [Staphylococcus intermedius]|uniref:DUF4097 family beta strand repeat-containing protein n=1 Tax=Staphylococcus intermedius TaxID=1285 RepID=UPI000BBCD52E|nr:DUF4097 family beta strand repeat-containing protein [Staphylococcus intermedius]PCF86785.1 hypothetical protein B4W76_06955 [Staphylococcus intermedius]